MITEKTSVLEALHLDALREILESTGPCVTLLLPPYHPGEPAHPAAALLKADLQDAVQQLAERRFPKDVSDNLLAPLKDLADDPASLIGSRWGRVVFLSLDILRQFQLNLPVQPSVTVAGCFRNPEGSAGVVSSTVVLHSGGLKGIGQLIPMHPSSAGSRRASTWNTCDFAGSDGVQSSRSRPGESFVDRHIHGRDARCALRHRLRPRDGTRPSGGLLQNGGPRNPKATQRARISAYFSGSDRGDGCVSVDQHLSKPGKRKPPWQFESLPAEPRTVIASVVDSARRRNGTRCESRDRSDRAHHARIAF